MKYEVVKGTIHGVSVGGTVELDPKEAKAYWENYVKAIKEEKKEVKNAKNKAILTPKKTK